VWVSSETYIFPIIEKNKGWNLKFQHHWLKMFKWLAHSEISQGGFCKVCLIFSRTGGFRCQKLYTLVIKPMDNFKKALEVCL
jgi:hypothetical protein